MIIFNELESVLNNFFSEKECMGQRDGSKVKNLARLISKKPEIIYLFNINITVCFSYIVFFWKMLRKFL